MTKNFAVEFVQIEFLGSRYKVPLIFCCTVFDCSQDFKKRHIFVSCQIKFIRRFEALIGITWFKTELIFRINLLKRFN